MKKKIILAGGGGHCKVIIDAIRKSGEFDIYGVVDPNIAPGKDILGVKVIGGDDMLPALFDKGLRYAFIGVGSVGDCGLRKKIGARLLNIGFKLPVIAHPGATIADRVELGAGTFVSAGAIINPGVRTGRNVIINTSSSVDHDCIIGDFVHIAPGAVLSGGIKIGDEAHVGTGARITQYLTIGRRCMIGAGQTVRHDMPDGQKSYMQSTSGRMKKDKSVFIIAEAGVNHNGSLDIARKMVSVAVKSGADAIKFQTFKAESLAAKTAPKAAYQKISSLRKESQFDMLKRLELSEDAHRKLISYCKKTGIIFLSTPFDKESVELLVKLGLAIFKIPSGEITNLPYLRQIGRTGKRVILSTGMSDMREVGEALSTLTAAGTRREDITLLHCSTEYPAPYKDVNLRAMVRMGRDLGVAVGYSDHTLGIEVPIAAVALGAAVIEKHFTLDRKMKGPDHAASLEPRELKAMISSIRNIEKALGSDVKAPAPSEIRNRRAIRKSICAAKDIKKGELLDESNITVKRPGTGISPMEWDAVVGRAAKRDYTRDEIINR